MYNFYWTRVSNKAYSRVMGRTKTFDEQAVINAAIAVFSEHGYTGTDVGLVCERAQIGRSSFYNTFESLDSVFLRALRNYSDTGIPAREEMLADDRPAPLVLFDRLDSELSAQCADDKRIGCLSANTVAELGRQMDSVSEILDENHDAWIETYSTIIDRGQESGHIRADIDPDVNADLFHSVLAGLRVAARVLPVKSIRAQSAAFVSGLCTDPGRTVLDSRTESSSL